MTFSILNLIFKKHKLLNLHNFIIKIQWIDKTYFKSLESKTLFWKLFYTFSNQVSTGYLKMSD